MNLIHPNIVCCYLYPISKYGYPPEAQATLQHIQEMKQLGFQSIELEGIHEHHLMEIYSIRHRLKAEVESLGLKVPYFCTVLPGLSSPDEKVRKKNLELFRKGCEIAQLLGSEGVLDNAPLPPWQFPSEIPITRHYEEDTLRLATFPKDLVWDSYWQDLIQTFRMVCNIAAEYGLSYQLHPAKGVLAANTDAFLYFAEAVNHPALRFNFDTANLFVQQENLSLSLRRLIKYIDYIHISDNGGHHTEHLGLGAGVIPWDSFFDTISHLNFQGYWGIDIGGAESSVPDLNKAYIHAAQLLEKQLF